MRILDIRQAPPGSNTIARFDVQLDGMRFFNLSLKRTGAGLRVFAPSAFGSAAVTFTPEISEALVALAVGEIAHDETRAALFSQPPIVEGSANRCTREPYL